MIGAMRRNIKLLSVSLWVVIAAFIGTTFLVWGKGSINVGGGPAAVARVNGEEIPRDRFQLRYQAHVDFYRQAYGDRFTAGLPRRLGLPQQVLEDLVREELVIQRAEAEGIVVSDQELNARVHAIAAFQENGQFSLERYRRVLQLNGLTPATFESEERRRLIRRKVEALVKEGIKVSEAEIRQAYSLGREKVRAAWALIELEPLMEKVDASESEVEAYFRDRSVEFRLPERRRLQYVALKGTDFIQPASDAEVEAYYKEHGAEFVEPRQVQAAHILVRVPEVGGSGAEEKARARVEEAIRRAQAGEDFVGLAKEISEDPGSAGSGGDLGYVARGEMVPQFEEALFALKEGEITGEPVRTAFGYHAIKALDIREGGKRPLTEVAVEIRERLKEEQGDSAAREKAEEARTALQSARDFHAEARKLGLEAKEVVLARGDPLEGIGRDPNVEEAAFGLAVGGISTPVKTTQGYVVLKAIEHLASVVPALSEIKDRVADAVKRQKAEARALERARELALAVVNGGDLVALAEKDGFPGGDTGLFSPSELGADPEVPGGVMRAALETAVRAVSEPVKTPRGIYLVSTLERKPPDPAGLEEARADLKEQVLSQKRNHAWASWVEKLRAGAEVEVLGQLPGAG
ncbi:MAG: SurA N-terminal domain-containing protein [Candidatus Methylomirabilia bacterium]